MTAIRATGRSNGRRLASGFTLIEVMVVVAIVGIIAAIAYPAYTDSVIKGKRGQGRAALVDLLQQEERYFTQNNSYLAFASGATGNVGTDASGSSTLPVPFKTTVGESVSQSPYKLGAAACTGLTLKECVVVTATPNSPFVDPAVNNLSIQSTGAKSCDGTNQAICWSR